ncbi:MAG: hypothetical protein KA484_02210 [Rhodocyclaceae bacterium]|nr:hypothetical protein [Rhodocyclaceae bacterium]
MKIFLDTEFTNLDEPDLISVGFVADHGAELYIVLSDFDHNMCSDFVKANVLPLLDRENPEVLSRGQAIDRMTSWLMDQRTSATEVIELVADHSIDFELIPPSVISEVGIVQFFNVYTELSRSLLLQFAVAQDEWHHQIGIRHHSMIDARGLKFAWDRDGR